MKRIVCGFIMLVICLCITVPCYGAEAGSSSSVELTEAEKQYIKDNPRVSIAIDTSWIPYGFSGKGIEVGGIIPDLMATVADRVGMKVDLVAKNTYMDAITACNSGETMLVSGIANDPKMSEKNNVLITDPYITIGYTAVTKGKIEGLYTKDADYKVAICVGTYAKMAMQEKMPSYEFAEYHSNKECMDAVVNDEADIALVANYSVGYYSSWHEYNQLHTIQINDFSWGLCFGVNKNSDPMLIEILNKGIASLSDNDVNQAIYKGAVDASSSTSRLSDIFYKHPGLIAAIATTAAILVVGGVFFYILQHRKIAALNREKGLLEDIHQKDLLLNSIPTGIGVFEIVKGVTQERYLNDSFYRLVDDTRENRMKWAGNNFINGVKEEDRHIISEGVERLIKGDEQTELTYRAVKPSGGFAWIHVTALVTLRDGEKITVYCGMSCVDEEVKNRNELQESAKVIDSAMKSANMMVWDYDFRTHRSIFRNMNAEQHGSGRIIENVPESLIQSGYIHPDSAAAYREAYESLGRSSKPVQGDFLVHLPDGDGYLWERIILTPIYENGSLIKAIGTSINITSYKEKERHYIQLVDRMEEEDDKDLIAKGRHNLTRNAIMYYSRKSSGSLQLPDGETFDYALHKMVETAASQSQADDIYRLLNRQALLKDYASGKTEGSIEYKRKMTRDFSYWSLLKYSMYEEPNSGDVIFFVYTYDISQRVLENHIIAKLGTIEYDKLGLIDMETGRYEHKKVDGIDEPDNDDQHTKGDYNKEVIRSIENFVPKLEQEMLKQKLSLENVVKQLEKQNVYFVTYSFIEKEGYYDRKKIQFCYLDETHTTIFYYRSDITDTYNREQDQLRLTEEALDAAKRASAAKTEFFSRMSHDMRTPMNGILGLADLSASEEDPGVLKENIKRIHESGEYLLGLINDTLDFQKIESGRMNLEPEIVSAREIIENVVGMIKTTADKKGVGFHMTVKNANLDCYVKVDPMRMKQIFMNLLSNAVKFTPSGGTVEVCFECIGHTGSVDHDLITVSDTGIGMSEEFLKNGIFKPFSQEHNAVTANYAGTGLGLSIAKKLIEMMHGNISVESEIGVGTKFTIAIDFETVDKADAVKSTSDAEQRKVQANAVLNGRNILLAEDHPLNAEIATRLLAKVGCTVSLAKDGRECVEKFAQSKPDEYDVILMDIRMPFMDGLEATRRIRAQERPDAKTIPVIAMTANAYDEDVKQSYAAGMNAHISKPIEPLVMYETIADTIVRCRERN